MTTEQHTTVRRQRRKGETKVGIEVVEAKDTVAAFWQREGGVGADEAGGACDEDGEAAGAAGGGGVADLLFPGGGGAGVEGEEEYGFDHPGGITIPCRISECESVQTRITAGRGRRKLMTRKMTAIWRGKLLVSGEEE
ncbi:unnamed protein product [Camellia sinensis]